MSISLLEQLPESKKLVKCLEEPQGMIIFVLAKTINHAQEKVPVCISARTNIIPPICLVVICSEYSQH